MAYNILIYDIEIRVAYIAIIGYIIFCLSTLCIVWLCFKERTGIAELREAPNIDSDNYDPSAFNADVNINMNKNKEIDLAEKFRLKRAKTEIEMIHLEPHFNKNNEDIMNLDEFEDENMFNDINLSNNPLSNHNNNMLEQLQINNSTMRINKNDAIRLEDLSNLTELNPYDTNKKNLNDSTQRLQVNIDEKQINNGYMHMAGNSSASYHENDNYDFANSQVVISMNNNNNNNKKEVRVFVEEDEDDINCFNKLLNGKCIQYIFSSINKLTLYSPIFFHFWDMATDLAVLCDWIPDSNWNEANSSLSPSTTSINTFYFMIGSIISMLTYRIVSGYRYAVRFNPCGGILQFLDIMLFFEIYASISSKKGQSTLQLRWIRKMESVLESAPQAFIQLVYVLRLNSFYSSQNISIIVQISLLFSILSITSSVVRSDEWKIRDETNANKMCPPNWRFIIRSIFRLFEITTRLCIMALLSQINYYGPYIVIFILGIEIVFYLIMYKDGFLGNDLGNIIEILIVHPNLSLRISDEELKIKRESSIGWILRTLLCWTPIAGIIICCFNKEKKRKKQKRSICNMCIHSNLVTVHFIHRCCESFVELIIFMMAYYINNNNTIFLFNNNNNYSFTRIMFIVAIFGTIITPFLYLISYRWFIIGQDVIEMNVFGFLHHAHCEDDVTHFIRFVYRVRSSVNNKNKFNRTPLMEAVLLKNYDLCKFLCSLSDIINLSITDCNDDDDNDDIDDENNNNNNNYKNKEIIHYVAELGDERLMKLILDAKEKQDREIFDIKKDNKHNVEQMDIDAIYGKQKKTALIICSEMGHSSCCLLLLQYGANVDYQDSLGRTSLHYSIFGESSSFSNDNNNKNNNEESNNYKLLIKNILLYSPNLNLFDNKRRWTPLFQAVGGGSIEIVDLLINSKLDLIDIKGDSLLHVAVRYNRYNVLKYLLTSSSSNRHWNLLHKNLNNETALKLSILNKYILCLKILINFGKESNKSLMKGLLLSVKINCIEITKILIRHFKVDPNFIDKDQMTPLRWAAFNGYKQIMKELLIGGARDDLDQFGQNIVFYAAKNNHLHILQLLQKANADFCVVNYEGQTATDKTSDKLTIQFIQNVRNLQLQYH